jgi:CBS domain-containing protein
MRIMLLNNVTGLPVVNDDGAVVGVITERDVLKLLNRGSDKPGTVEEFMTTNVVCFEQDARLSDVADCLMMNRFRRVPVLAQGRLVGIISRRDIIQHINHLEQEAGAAQSSDASELVY